MYEQLNQQVPNLGSGSKDILRTAKNLILEIDSSDTELAIRLSHVISNRHYLEKGLLQSPKMN